MSPTTSNTSSLQSNPTLPLIDAPLLDSKIVGPFLYRRFQIQSRILGRPLTCGLLTFSDAPADARARATFYILHGGNGDDTQTIDAGLPTTMSTEVLATLRSLGAQIVLPMIGASFLHDHPKDPERSYFRYFQDEIMPAAESGSDTSAQTRFLIGYSTGGQAALNCFLKEPELFRGVGVHFPVVPTYDYTSSADTQSFVERTSANPAYVDVAVQCFQAVFVDGDDFKRHHPLHQLSQADPTRLAEKRIYFDAGSSDEFGLFEGTRRLRDSLQAQNVEHHYNEVTGGRHDTDFLRAQFPKLVEYLVQSR